MTVDEAVQKIADAYADAETAAQEIVTKFGNTKDAWETLRDNAVIGGAFVPVGGQNLIEACAAGTPAVLGPSMFNFAEATRLALEAGAAIQADEARQGIAIAFSLLEDSGRRKAMGEAGMKLCSVHRGATQRQLQVCLELLRAPARG